MYNIEFYENQSGESELWNFLEKLRNEAATNKDSRIQYKQMMFYIELLQNNGTRLGENITKHLDNEIWEYTDLKNSTTIRPRWKSRKCSLPTIKGEI